MSRNAQIDYTRFVHQFTDSQGRTRWAVAEWDEEQAQYVRPLDSRSRALTGCHTEFASFHNLPHLGGYLTRRQALRRARYLFGPDPEL